MPALTRRGVTLPELLVALTLAGILAGAAIGLLRRTQDGYHLQSQQIEVRQNLRIASSFLSADLRELDAADGDIVAMGPSAITIRALRQLGVLCRSPRGGATLNSVVLVLRDDPFAALRDFNPATDSLWVFADGDTGTPDDDSWVPGAISSVGADTCPDGLAGRRLSAALQPVPGRPPGDWGVLGGAPVLGFETLSYRVYRSGEDGRWYVGLQTATDLQPILGPVTNDGLAFSYLDSAAGVTAQRSKVRMVEIRVRAPTVDLVRGPQGRLEHPLDSLLTVVALRNNRRF